jgi:hypothetical protein
MKTCAICGVPTTLAVGDEYGPTVSLCEEHISQKYLPVRRRLMKPKHTNALTGKL